MYHSIGDTLKNDGVEVYDWSPEEKAKLIGALKPVADQMVDDLNQDGHPGTEILNVITRYLQFFGVE